MAVLLGLAPAIAAAAASWHMPRASGQIIPTTPPHYAWTVLFDGRDLSNWNQLGNASWRIDHGTIVATKGGGLLKSLVSKGEGFLVSKNSYADFQLRVEFWFDSDAHSGVFLRCRDPNQITAADCYEIPIDDKPADPSYGSGAIVGLAPVKQPAKAAGKWNAYEITATGQHLTVTLNGTKTADVQNPLHRTGHIALHLLPGEDPVGFVKIRRVEIKPL